MPQIPIELQQLYAIHHGFGDHGTYGVEVFHRSDELSRVEPDHEKLLVACYCGGAGDRLVFAKDKLAKIWDGLADWDHETGEVTVSCESDRFARQVARAVLDVDVWDHPNWAEELLG